MEECQTTNVSIYFTIVYVVFTGVFLILSFTYLKKKKKKKLPTKISSVLSFYSFTSSLTIFDDNNDNGGSQDDFHRAINPGQSKWGIYQLEGATQLIKGSSTIIGISQSSGLQRLTLSAKWQLHRCVSHRSPYTSVATSLLHRP